jgi:Na+/proline symporter
MIYMMGTQVIASILLSPIGAFIACELFIPIFYKMNLNSINEYLLKRFNSRELQVTANISTLIAMVLIIKIKK